MIVDPTFSFSGNFQNKKSPCAGMYFFPHSPL